MVRNYYKLTRIISFKPIGPDEIDHDLKRARNALGDTGFAASWASGSGLPTQVFTEVIWLSRQDSPQLPNQQPSPPQPATVG